MNCPRCGSRMVHYVWTLSDREEYHCHEKKCSKIRERIQKQARRDERSIRAQEADFATYTASIIDLHARRAREVSQKR